MILVSTASAAVLDGLAALSVGILAISVGILYADIKASITVRTSITAAVKSVDLRMKAIQSGQEPIKLAQLIVSTENMRRSLEYGNSEQWSRRIESAIELRDRTVRPLVATLEPVRDQVLDLSVDGLPFLDSEHEAEFIEVLDFLRTATNLERVIADRSRASSP